MELVRDTPFEVGWHVFQLRPPQPTLCVQVKGTFTIRPSDAACVVADEQLLLSGDVHYDEDIANSVRIASDIVPIKPAGECYVAGTCYPPEGRATQSAVAFRIGSVTRAMAVFGDRSFRGTALGAEITPPEPFEAMPLRYERCFGGPDFEDNPVGQGLPRAGATKIALPNLEDPSQLIQSRGDRPPNAGWFPIPATWSARARRLGTYDMRWVKTRWPWFAEDFDIAYFNACPAAQRIQGFWRGNEEILLQNLVRGRPRMTTRLPGLRARCFVNAQGAPAGTPLREIPMVLDTIAVDADALTVTCLWRGTLDVRDERLDEIAHLFACDEALTARDDASALRARFDRALAADERSVEDEETEVGARPRKPATPKVEKFAADPVFTQIVEHLERAAANAPMSPPAAPLPTPAAVESLAAQLEAAGIGSATEVRAVLGAVTVESAPAPTPRAPQPMTRERVRAMIQRGESLSGKDLSGVDLSGERFDGANFAGAILRGAQLRGARFDRCVFDGAMLMEADLSESSFVGARFAECEMARVRATRADFSRAVLDGAAMLSAVCTEARFVEATGEGLEAMHGVFSRADFTGAKLPEADFGHSKLDGANFQNAVLTSADFSGVDGTRAQLSDATLEGLRAGDGARFQDAVIRNAKADRSIWLGAKLDRANFTFTALERADFSGASLTRATLHGCNVKSAQFRAATLVGARMNKSDAREANFEACDLAHADLRGSNFHAAAFWRARFDGADLQLAIVTGTLLATER